MTRSVSVAVLCTSALCGSLAAQEPAARQVRDVGGITDQKAMLLKYVARCALEPGQTLLAAPDALSSQPSFAGAGAGSGSIGLAPEWMSGSCGEDCQERVSSCLLALVNRTGKHVQLSLVSAAASLVGKLGPNANDRSFPYQEGAFFGNVWSGKAFSCRGEHVNKAPQVKRFCAVDPASCSSDLAPFVDAGLCSDACQMRCFAIGDGERRCVATSCRDPRGGIWKHPISTLLRNSIEAANADELQATDLTEGGLRPRAPGARARFEALDFGAAPAAERTLVASFAGATAGASVEVWLGDARKLGTGTTIRTTTLSQHLAISLRSAGIVGSQPLVLRLRGGRALGQLTEIELL